MNFKKRFTAFIAVTLIFCLCSETAACAGDSKTSKAKTVKVLMVGNSLTSFPYNYTIKYLKNLAKKSGKSITIKYLAYNNEKLENWADQKNKHGKKMYAEIKKKKWDYIVLQEQTSAATTDSFIDASKKIASYIHKKSPKSEIIYNCTWAYKKGKKVSGKSYTFDEMQKKMNKNYETAAKKTGGAVCWSGKAFLAYRKGKGKKKELYLKDNNHASKYGWYLNACCLYCAIFGRSPEKSTYYAGFSKKLAKQFQGIAADQNGI